MIDQTVICTYVALCENMSALQLLVGPSEGMISGRLGHLEGWGSRMDGKSTSWTVNPRNFLFKTFLILLGLGTSFLDTRALVRQLDSSCLQMEQFPKEV